MVDKGLRGLLGPTAPPYNQAVTWANGIDSKHPFGTTPYIDIQGYANNNTSLNGDGAEMGACRQGMVRIQLTRTTAHGSLWDGNSDLALRVYCVNAVSSGAYGGLKAIECQARANQNCASVTCISANARTSSGKTVATNIGMEMTMECYGTVTTMYGVKVDMREEGAAPTTSAAFYAYNSNASLATAIGAALMISKGATNLGFNYAIDAFGADCINTACFRFYDDGTVCDDANAQAITNCTTAGYLTVVVGTATRYIWLGSNKPTA